MPKTRTATSEPVENVVAHDEQVPPSQGAEGDLEYRRTVARAELLLHLKRAREALGLRQEDLGKLIGTTQSAVSNIETGRVDPQLDTLLRFAAATDRSLTLTEPFLINTVSEVLSILYMGRPQPHTLDQLAGRLQTTPTHLRQLLDRLLSAGWAQVAAGEEDTYMLTENAGDVIGLAILDDHVVGVLLSADRRVQGRSQKPLLPVSPRMVEEVVIETIQELQEASRSTVLGVGISIAGIVDSDRGKVQYAPALRSEGVLSSHPLRWELGATLRDAVRLPVVVTNDANTLAVEERLREGEPRSVAAFLLSGVGVGSGLIISDHCPAGANAAAGEIGHLPISDEGPACPSGLPHRGCVEAYVSTMSMLGRLGIKAGSREDRRLGLKQMEGLLREGDESAQKALDEAGSALARAVAATVLSIDPDVTVICGEPGLIDPDSVVSDRFRETVMRELGKLSASRALFLPAPIVEWRPLSLDSLAISAGTTALLEFLRDPEMLIGELERTSSAAT